MPIYLGPISRRRFLQAAIMTTAGIMTGCSTPVQGRTDPNAFALLSDTHIDADAARIARGINMTGHLEKVAGELLNLPTQTAHVFVAGDLAYNSGQAGDYSQLAKLLLPIRQAGYPVHLALGNHDHRERFWAGFKEQKKVRNPVADRQTLLLETPNVNWFILDSLQRTNSTPGLLGAEQLQWLATSLDANSRKPAIVLVHHNPGIQENMGLLDTMALYEVIRPRRQVKAYIYGHTHTWKITRDESGIHLINLPPVAYVFRENDPAGWVHAKVRQDSICLELRCIDEKHPSHGEVQDLVWRS